MHVHIVLLNNLSAMETIRSWNLFLKVTISLWLHYHQHFRILKWSTNGWMPQGQKYEKDMDKLRQ